MINFNIVQLNSPFDDSVFFVKNIYMKKSFLFDCGRLGCISHSDILSLKYIFISHTHMDHFYGFDRVLRGSIASHNILNIFGPKGIIENIEGKLKGYTWNLAQDYSFCIEAYELNESGNHKKAIFKAQNKFIPIVEDISFEQFEMEDGFKMNYEFFDHSITSIGYRISEPVHYNFNDKQIDSMGYIRGPWMSKLKKALNNKEKLQIIEASTLNGSYNKTAEDLCKELITVKEPEVIVFITDISPIKENIDKAVSFANNATLLIIESVFSDEDIEHAQKKNHLTAGIAKDIFIKSNSKLVRFTHFASRYEHCKSEFLKNLYNGIGDKICHFFRG